MKAVSVKMPMGLYQKVTELASKNHLSVHAYILRALWNTTRWDGKEVDKNPERAG